MRSCLPEDCLKLICTLGGAGTVVHNSMLVSRLGAPGSTIGAVLHRLADVGLLERTPYRGVRLTPDGSRQATRLLRRQRVLESFLVGTLGYSWYSAPGEADRLEHAESDELVERLSVVLGDPQVDPHGAPIPRSGTVYEEPALPPLAGLKVGEKAVLRRVTEEDEALLRYLASIGLTLGSELEVLQREPFDGPIRVRWDSREVALGQPLTQWLRVEPVEEATPGEAQAPLKDGAAAAAPPRARPSVGVDSPGEAGPEAVASISCRRTNQQRRR